MECVRLRNELLEEHNSNAFEAKSPSGAPLLHMRRVAANGCMRAKKLTFKALQPAWQHAAYVVRLTTQ
jgi:hypothetical protein